MSLPDRTARARVLARNYGGDRDGWTRVEKHRRVAEYAATHPDAVDDVAVWIDSQYAALLDAVPRLPDE